MCDERLVLEAYLGELTHDFDIGWRVRVAVHADGHEQLLSWSCELLG